MNAISFTKMHANGNDFVFVDCQISPINLTKQQIARICDRRYGVGCDQMIFVENPKNEKTADVFMTVYNNDGNRVEACGNAARCLGKLCTEQFGKSVCKIETVDRVLITETRDDHQVTVDLGKPKFGWNEIPLSMECDTSSLPINFGELANPFSISMGNPHMLFFVDINIDIDLNRVGPELSVHRLFPNGTNVEVVQVIDRQTIRVNVYERGAGITPCCGTGAAASVVAAVHRNLTETDVQVIMEGGPLFVSYKDTVKLTGPVSKTFHGTLDD